MRCFRPHYIKTNRIVMCRKLTRVSRGLLGAFNFLVASSSNGLNVLLMGLISYIMPERRAACKERAIC